MKESNKTKDYNLEDLDETSQALGVGGYVTNEKSEINYQKRMEKRKEVQVKRVSQRNKEKSLILVFTGHGKGKTTAALGLALRTLGYRKKVAIIQFIKGAWEPGETNALKSFGDLIQWHAIGSGFTWETQDRKKDKDMVNKAWEKAKFYLDQEEYKLVILDEINFAINLGYLSIKEVIDSIKKRPSLTHVVLTGRNAKKELIDVADLVTEMKLIHHPFKEQGVKAQEGIEF